MTKQISQYIWIKDNPKIRIVFVDHFILIFKNSNICAPPMVCNKVNKMRPCSSVGSTPSLMELHH